MSRLLSAGDPRDLPPPEPGGFDADFAREMIPILLDGLVVTVQVTLLGTAMAVVLGLVLTLGRRARLRPVSMAVGAAVELVRSTPLLVQLFLWFIAMPEATGLTLDPLPTGVLALGVHYGAYASETYRAGIENVPAGQWEAATAVDLSRVGTWRFVVLPQAVPTVIPALGNHLIAMLKDAPLLSSISVLELLAQARRVQGVWFRGMEPFTVAGILFLAVSIPAALAVRYLERRYGFQRV